jgi:hypothetical protein
MLPLALFMFIIGFLFGAILAAVTVTSKRK